MQEDPPLLLPEELAFFAHEGYVIRRGFLSPELCARASTMQSSKNSSRELEVTLTRLTKITTGRPAGSAACGT